MKIGLRREDAHCWLKLIVGINQIATRLRWISPPLHAGVSIRFKTLSSLSCIYFDILACTLLSFLVDDILVYILVYFSVYVMSQYPLTSMSSDRSFCSETFICVVWFFSHRQTSVCKHTSQPFSSFPNCSVPHFFPLCQDGKANSATVVVAFLIFVKLVDSVTSALHMFSTRRGFPCISPQKRYDNCPVLFGLLTVYGTCNKLFMRMWRFCWQFFSSVISLVLFFFAVDDTNCIWHVFLL